MRGQEGAGRRQRRDADRVRLAEFEQDGFVPAGPWRDAEARIAAMEHAMRAKIREGVRILTIHRAPKWVMPERTPTELATVLREQGVILPDTFGDNERLVITP